MMKIQKQKGITLIELMVSMVIGLIIIGASLQIFLTVKKLTMLQQGIARIQENARIASILLQEQITTSGNFGCNRLAEDLAIKVSPDIDAKIFGLDNHKGLEGAHFSKLKSEVKKRVKRKVTSSDILWIKRVRDKHLFFNKTARSALEKGVIIVISDCNQVNVLRNKPNDKETEYEFMRKYTENTEIGILSSTLLYVGNTYRKNANGSPINSLYSTDINGRTLELVEGAEDFKVFYGTGNNEIIYWDYNNLPAGEKIVKIQIRILLTSIEDALSTSQVYQIDGENHLPKDRLMRMWWIYEFPIWVM